ncbi:MDR family MFS transporter [Lentzea flaviverrucosa]|uniref:Predicted arabinose efflux permease, MFS family n=1 Tax=Lentzea flaviverrucosa TaxID=200379 RepID=A0A1H9F4E8_9PSEU|nr:MFS transporter [Lentzea flaviverrucosa]RDI35312.1 putative MFS family arabinose efflux permease [Lentzea flaviverrucosa]SEQ32781.1 Predicted arabinose efflux permease, MFS family [Lentzea flaviverrucosa]
MTNILRQFRSFDRPVQLLLLNQFSINVGFYMLMPYLAVYLSGELALAGWAIGLVLGVRNFSQQGMFLIGGTLADRLGYKPLIVAGCALRTAGFGLLGFVDTLPALIIASAATGFAGALFNPAVRAYVANDAGPRRVEAFALFNVFYQTGILVGPLIGLVLTGVDFSLTCAVAAVVFAVLTVLQIRSLPARKAATRTDSSVLQDWRGVFGNRRFVLFAAAMIGSYVLSFQIYLALPLEARRIAGDGVGGTVLVAALFAVSGVLAIAGQLRVTGWFRQRFGTDRSLVIGMLLLAVAFLPLALPTPSSGPLLFVPVLLSATLIAFGTMVVFPFEMDTIVALSGDRLVATHYGLYNTVVGVGILAGNLFTGTALDLARGAGVPALPWLALTALGLFCAWSLRALNRVPTAVEPVGALTRTKQ